MERSRVEVDLGYFIDNINALKQFLLPGQEWLQIVKADAYGHGAFEIATTALQQGASYLGIANADEGRLLRIQNIKAPILILSPALVEEISIILEYDLTPTVSDMAFARALSLQAISAQKTVNVHVKVDTGMHRSGFEYEDFAACWLELKELPQISIEGIYTHYAASENDSGFTSLQTERFERILSSLVEKPRFVHLSNSSGILRHNSFTANLVRLGILSYGVYTEQSQYELIRLKSVMSFRSSLVQVHNLPAGESVGYNRLYTAVQDGRYGIIPVGYADGYDFLLSNKGIVSIDGQICPVIGKVSMDMTAVDISALPHLKAGAEVVLMGGGSNLLRAEQLTSRYHGSAYELLCQIGRRAPRHYYQNGRLISSEPLSRRSFVPTDYTDGKLSHIISSAISQRLQDDEIADLVYKEVLRGLFYQKDNDIALRSAFVHDIAFTESEDYPDYYVVNTKLSFRKKLQNDYFIVACATSEEVLMRYFLRRDVEYRWLLDGNIELNTQDFNVTRVSIDRLNLRTVPALNNGCMEIKCTHPRLMEKVGQEVTFTIQTQTIYPKTSHQMSVFISEMTRGIAVSFSYPQEIESVDPVCIFAGQNKYPTVSQRGRKIYVKSGAQEWILPNSGIVFAY